MSSVVPLDLDRARACVAQLRPLDLAELAATGREGWAPEQVAAELMHRQNSFAVLNARGEAVGVFGLAPVSVHTWLLWGLGGAGLTACMPRVTRVLRAMIRDLFARSRCERIETQVLKENHAAIEFNRRCLGLSVEGVRRGAAVGGSDYVLMGIIRRDLDAAAQLANEANHSIN